MLALPTEFGTTAVKLGDAEPVSLDLWAASEAYEAAVRTHADKGDDKYPAVYRDVADWLTDRGLKVTPLVAETVVSHVFAEINALRKKNSAALRPDSPTSTE